MFLPKSLRRYSKRIIIITCLLFLPSSVHAAGERVSYSTDPFNPLSRVYIDTTSVSAQEIQPEDIAFSSDGTKMFVIGTSGDDVNEYDLSTPWDVSTRVFVDATSIGAQEASPTGIAFSTDGTKMFIIGFTGDDVNDTHYQPRGTHQP